MTLDDEEPKDYVSKLALLLLNDGMDALRWFSHEHLPRGSGANKAYSYDEVLLVWFLLLIMTPVEFPVLFAV